jgi:hypothetical protein
VQTRSSAQVRRRFSGRPDFLPLNGPVYLAFLPDHLASKQNVEWTSSLGTLAGAGDLFWDPSKAPQGTVESGGPGGAWQLQKTQLLNCTASSMREVYLAGDQAHGKAPAKPALNGIHPSDDGCWVQRATNESIFGAYGVLPVAYASDAESIEVQTFLAIQVNDAILDDRKNATGFAFDNINSKDPAEKARAADRENFIQSLKGKLNVDSEVLGNQYRFNAAKNPTGTESAQGFIHGHPGATISMLGVEPADAPPPPAHPGDAVLPPVPYADKWLAQETAAGALPDSGTLDSAISRLFWRGNLERTCRTSVANGAQELLSLQARCIAASAHQGDPNACTACVELAEPHIPMCPFSGLPYEQKSKCSVLGADSIESPPDGLPKWWFNFPFRVSPTTDPDPSWPHSSEDLCNSSIDVAEEWCTGTDYYYSADPSHNNMAEGERDSVLSYVQAGSTTGCQPDYAYGAYHMRRAEFLLEDLSHTPTEWVFSMISSFEYDYVTGRASPDPCKGMIVSSDTSIDRIRRVTDPAPINQLIVGGITAPRCGVRQRVSSWNQSCKVVLP